MNLLEVCPIGREFLQKMLVHVNLTKLGAGAQAYPLILDRIPSLRDICVGQAE